MKQKYYVTYRVDARYVAEVLAEDINEAKELAEAEWCDADFGEARDIEGEPIIIEDSHGTFVWER